MKKKSLFLLLTFILVTAHFIPLKAGANGSDLSDIGGHWAEKEIKRLVAREVISGYPDGTFRPNDPITRAEFVRLLVKAFNLKSDDESAKDQVFYKDTIKLNSKGLYTWMHF